LRCDDLRHTAAVTSAPRISHFAKPNQKAAYDDPAFDAAVPVGRKVKLCRKRAGPVRRDQSRAGRHQRRQRLAAAAQNPVGKIPVLVLEDGSTLYYSRVILEYPITVPAAARSFQPNRARGSRRCGCRPSPTA